MIKSSYLQSSLVVDIGLNLLKYNYYDNIISILNIISFFMKKNIPEITDEFQKTIKDITNHKDIKHIIEQIFEKSDNLENLRTALTLAISKYIKTNKIIPTGITLQPSKQEFTIEKEKHLDKEVSQFVNDVMELHGLNNKSKNFEMSNIRARKDFKRIVAHFAIYEIYKVMNPKRIAGESKKMNYAHNLIQGGTKLASKYEGGREADLKKYGANEVQKINKAARKIRNSNSLGF